MNFSARKWGPASDHMLTVSICASAFFNASLSIPPVTPRLPTWSSRGRSDRFRQ